jgi:glutaredoxin 3
VVVTEWGGVSMSWFSGSDGAAKNAAPPPSPDQTRDLVLYGDDGCGYCHRVYRSIDALGLGTEVVVRDVWSDPSARKKLVEATGRGTVPCLFIDGVPLFESRDIIDWLGRYAGREREAEREAG